MRDFLKSIALVGLIILFAVSSTYAYLNLSTSKNNATGSAGCTNFNVSYSGQQINSNSILSAESIRDDIGDYDSPDSEYPTYKYSTVALKKDPNCSIFSYATIYLHTDNFEPTSGDCAGKSLPFPAGTTFPDAPDSQSVLNAFRYRVINGTTGAVVAPYDSSNLIADSNYPEEFYNVVKRSSANQVNIPLVTVPLTDTLVTYKIYLWIDTNASYGCYNDCAFSGYFYADSVQTSTVAN